MTGQYELPGPRARVLVTDHYPSDVLFGAFIGIFTAIWAYRYFFGEAKPERRVGR